MAAIAVMPIADALAIVFVEPFILLVMGKWLFNEQVGRRRISASVIGFAGVLLVIQPSFSVFGLVALFPLGTALAFAFYMLVTRRLSRQMEPVPMQLHTATLATAMCLPVLLWGHLSDHPTLSPLLAPVMPEGIAWLWLLGVGVFASLSHMLITYALRFAPSATLAPLHYLEMVSAVSFGYLVFGDLPNLLTLTGVVIIVGSGLYIFHRERLTDKQPTASGSIIRTGGQKNCSAHPGHAASARISEQIHSQDHIRISKTYGSAHRTAKRPCASDVHRTLKPGL